VQSTKDGGDDNNSNNNEKYKSQHSRAPSLFPERTTPVLVTLSKVLIFMLPTTVKRDLVPPSPEHTIHIVQSLVKLNANLTMANVKAETCS
jgi:hypothetical protein